MHKAGNAYAIIHPMKRTLNGGYTIIETMIYLTVASALMTSAMLVVSGKQERVRYTQSINTFDEKIRDTFNDVSTGYYPSSNNFRCQSNDGVLSFTVTAREQGTNNGCIFLGKAIEFGPGTAFNVYTMAGAQGATTLGAAGVQLLGMGANLGTVERNNVDVDNSIAKVVSLTDTGRNVKGIAIISQFSEISPVNGAVTGNGSKADVYEVLDNFKTNAGAATMPRVDKGVALCLQQGAGGRKSTITINANLSTETLIDQWRPECGA